MPVNSQRRSALLVVALFSLGSHCAWAAPGIQAVTVVTDSQGGQSYTVTIQILALMTLLTLLPALLLTMTSADRHGERSEGG